MENMEIPSPKRPRRKSRRPAKIMDDMFEFFPPADNKEIKEEQSESEEVDGFNEVKCDTSASPTKRRENVTSPEKESSLPTGANRWSKLTYADIIEEALMQVDAKMLSLDDINDYVAEKYPGKTATARWKESVRVVLRRHSQFEMIGQDWRLCSDHSQDPLKENFDQSVKTELDIECVEDDFSPNPYHNKARSP